MNILVTLDSNYIYPLCVMFNSLAKTNAENRFDVYVAYSSLTEDDFAKMEKALKGTNAQIHRIRVDNKIFSSAPVLDRLSKETYYRLLIGDILPQDVHKILYLDPDIVINQNLAEFYNTELTGKVVAAARHLPFFVEKFNLVRLKMKLKSHYINAGVLLINLDEWRNAVTLQEILDYISMNIGRLWLADQDVINKLFEFSTVYVDERRFNLDEKVFRRYSSNRVDKSKRIDLDWVRKNTAVIHFNGKHKPWRECADYIGKLGEFFAQNKDI